MIKLHSDLDPDEAAEDLLDWSISHWNVLLVWRHVLTLTSTLEWLLVLMQMSLIAILKLFLVRDSILINLWDDVSKVDRNMLRDDVRVSFTLLLLSYNAF